MYIGRILPHDWLSEWARPDPAHALTTLETVIGYLYVIGVTCTRGRNLGKKPPVSLPAWTET
jgi:hypothetical protein